MDSGPSENFTYDVFVSHSSKDIVAALGLSERLRSEGLRVWLDEWEIRAGDVIPLKLEQGLEQSRVLLLLMSASAFASEWVALERCTALFRDPTNVARRFVPLRLDDSPIKEALRPYAYIDWRTQAKEQYEALVKACQHAPTERATSTQQAPSRMLSLDADVIDVAMLKDGEWGVVLTSNGVSLFNLRTRITFCEIPAKDATAMAITRNGTCLVLSHGSKGEISQWMIPEGRLIGRIDLAGVARPVRRLAAESDGDEPMALIDDREGSLYRFEGNCWKHISNEVTHVAASPNGQWTLGLRNGSVGTVRRLDISITSKYENQGAVTAIASSNSNVLFGSVDGALVLRDLASRKVIAHIEGHTSAITSVGITPDGKFGVSASEDGRHFVWDLSTGSPIDRFDVHFPSGFLGSKRQQPYPVAVSPDGRSVLYVSYPREVALWKKRKEKSEIPALGGLERYTNAKVLLVGDSGVGKTGIASRLAGGSFEPTVSTDAVWASHLRLPHEDAATDIEREIWLWDFAGQSDYRLIHQLFMDETALAVFVFNPQNEDPFDGLAHWDADVKRAARREFGKLLVAGRCDRGCLMVSRTSIESFCRERRFAEYIETSALTGSGCEDLRNAIVRYIPWENIPWTASPRIFRLLKEACLGLRADGHVLLRTTELKQQLEMRLEGEHFSMAELRAVIGLLAGPGIISRLDFGDFVLLVPERINSYAAAVIRSVRGHTDEIGCIAEDRILAGELDYQDMVRLPRSQEDIVLRAMHQTFVDRGLCLREATEAGTLLVFPSYFRRERPELRARPATFVTYRFSGSLDEIYATLIVRLHHTKAFDRDQLWRFAADFKTQEGHRLGVKLVKLGNASGELQVYADLAIRDDTRVVFDRYLHEHLIAKAEDVTRMRHYVCPHCGKPIENQNAIRNRLTRGETDVVCADCEGRVPLNDLLEQKFQSRTLQRQTRDLSATANQRIGSETEELILSDHSYAVALEAGQKFERMQTPEFGIQARIEFTDYEGSLTGLCVQLQLRHSDSYYAGGEVFNIKDRQLAQHWRNQSDPVMLVARREGGVWWMDITSYLRQVKHETISAFQFAGEPMTALNLQRMRDRRLGKPGFRAASV